MSNANLNIITTSNTFLQWLVRDNDSANLVNGLLNGLFYSDNGSLTLANGSITLSAGAGTLLSVSGNTTISQTLTVGSILDSGDLTVQGNNLLHTAVAGRAQFANSATAKILVSNVRSELQNVNVAGYMAFTANNVSNTLAPNVVFFGNELAVINVANSFFVTITGNVAVQNNLFATQANVISLNVSANISNAGNILVTQNTTTGNLQVSSNTLLLGLTAANISNAIVSGVGGNPYRILYPGGGS
ncbi:MAG: hypothetical protein ACREQ5_05520, partial [Candidatus Dormibacteria bacterium]